MTLQQKQLLALVRCGLGLGKAEQDLFANMHPNDWMALLDYAQQEGVCAIAFDAFQKSGIQPPIDELMEWLGQSSYQETIYEQHKETIEKLAGFYSRHGLKMLLLKGLGLSFNYLIPNHRPCGDIDIYLYGDGGTADDLMLSELGIESRQNEEKHSVFEFEGITVENHACLINDTRHPSHKDIEAFFEKDAENAVPVNMVDGNMNGFFLPSAATNALYLPLHIADHFVHGEASLRQLCDWACFVSKYHNNISWAATESWAKKSGFFKFYCCLNGIVQDYLGIDASYFPDWQRDKSLEERVVNEILNKKESVNLSLLQKVIRFFSSAWKFKLVYNENILLAALRQARAYALVKWNKGGKGIWEK